MHWWTGCHRAESGSHLPDPDGIEAAFERLRRNEGARTVVILDEAAAGPLPAV